tara:strand:- start:2788 stop:3087 length:300 start_codon:yes stop_codon:yes gene_type:complete
MSTSSTIQKANWDTIATGGINNAKGIDFYASGLLKLILERMSMPIKASAFPILDTNKQPTGRWSLRVVTGTYEATIADPDVIGQTAPQADTNGASLDIE